MLKIPSLIRGIWHFGRQPSVFAVGLSLLFGAGLAMIYGGDFAFGAATLAAAALWAVAFWLDSDLLRSKRPKVPRPRAKTYDKAREEFRSRMIRYRLSQVGGAVTILVLLVGSVAFTDYKRNQNELRKFSGFLFPADEPSPRIPCAETRPDSVKVFFAGAVSVVSQFPHVVISANGSPRLWLNKGSDGAITISASVVSLDGRIISEIVNNRFVVNPNNYMQIERKDKSRLSVQDQYGRSVLDVRYLNRSAFLISSFVIYISTGDVVELAPVVGSPGMCFGDGGEQKEGDFDFSRNQNNQLVMKYKAYTGFGPVKSATTKPPGWP